MTDPSVADPMQEMHPVRRTISINAINVAQPGDVLPASAVESLGLKVGDDDDADVGPAGHPPVEVVEAPIEVRYDKPVVPLNGPLGNQTAPTDDAVEKKTTRRSSKDE